MTRGSLGDTLFLRTARFLAVRKNNHLAGSTTWLDNLTRQLCRQTGPGARQPLRIDDLLGSTKQAIGRDQDSKAT
jgi:hypothetical protein